MEADVVCISFSDGSGGREVARRVATELDFRLVDEEIVARAAREAGVERELVAGVERRKSLLERLVRELSSGEIGGASSLAIIPASGQPLAAGDAMHSSELRDLIRSAIEQTAAQGRTVIAAHAASVALEGRGSCLRALVIASPETRAQRIARSENVDARQAARLVQRGDAGRSDYLKRFYGRRAELPTSYDLVVNTDRLSEDATARLIVAAAGSGSRTAPVVPPAAG